MPVGGKLRFMDCFFSVLSGRRLTAVAFFCFFMSPNAAQISWTGRVVDARTGAPVPDIECYGGGKGRVDLTPKAFSDADGNYIVTYDGQANEETIPEGERAEETSNLTVPITDYWLRVNLAGYRAMDTATRGLSLTLQSSLTDAIRTQVDFALAPEGSAAGVEAATAVLVTPPVWRLTSSTLLNGEVGQALSYQISANNQPASFAATGLPAGLTLDPATGLITGNPETAGLFTIEVSAVGPEGTVSQRLTLVVRMTDGLVFDNGNIGGVLSGPSQPTTFTLAGPTRITYVSDYHYFNGGVLPGTIALRHEDGTIYGPWQASGRIGQGGVLNAYWEVWPVVVLKAGAYTVVDSHPATWSHNSQSGNRGFTILRGTTTTLDTPDVLATWAGNHGLTGEAAIATADPDDDQQPNWAELATGGNPALPDPVPGLALAVASGQLTVNVPLCAGGVGVPGSDFVVNGARVMIEVTPALGAPDWQPAIALLDLANAVRNNQGDGREILALPVKASLVPQGPWFIRERLIRIETP